VEKKGIRRIGGGEEGEEENRGWRRRGGGE